MELLITAISLLCLSLRPVAASVPGLFEALNLYGASDFAAALQASPGLLDAAISGQFGTVFAPIDSSFSDSSQYPSRVPLNPKEEQIGWYHDTIAPLSWGNYTDPPDPLVVGTIDSKANLGGRNQSIVVNVTRTASSNTSSLRAHRAGLPLLLDRYGQPQLQWTSYAEISTGLGDVVHVVNPNLEFAKCGSTNGVLHIVDKYFTVPQLLSDTAAQIPELSIFTELLNTSCSCLKVTLDNRASITAFIPTNEAFAAAGITSSTKGAEELVQGLVIPNFLGYTPNLAAQPGPATTMNGSTLKIHKTDNVGPNKEYRQDFYVNDAKVVKPNIILYNGVAHIIDRLPSI
ncbi:FAS1 domain-containing protein [Rhypophila decipiens]|uniref:FAS1 domain-containing protein n=1 Tax=Rhypophila decipiens TaxID=261697 RepID=A0AAN7BAM6_9PEZI|nr:FAS1 domain-containing protein [Rhypophila decipiens]